VLSALQDPELSGQYLAEMYEEYDQLREDYEKTRSERTFRTLQQARDKSYRIDWSLYTPHVPNNLGITEIKDLDLNLIIPYIDWNPFFSVW
jgi:5-methyltetrahydrofolate--homocysteine methyltransferase